MIVLFTPPHLFLEKILEGKKVSEHFVIYPIDKTLNKLDNFLQYFY